VDFKAVLKSSRFYVRLRVMKCLLLILVIFLSSFFGNGQSDANRTPSQSSAVIEQRAEDETRDLSSELYQVALLPQSVARNSEEENTVSSPGCQNSSVSSVKRPAKTNFRFVKSGKVIDRQSFQLFRTIICLIESGRHSTRRYIHTLCQLLI